MSQPDYEKILIAYIKHVFKSEGVHCLEHEEQVEELSPEEFTALLAACGKAGIDFPEEWTQAGGLHPIPKFS